MRSKIDEWNLTDTPTDWSSWISCHIDEETMVEDDFGLANIADQLGKSDAVKMYWQGAAKETEGDVDGAITLYKRAYHMWPALDSCTQGGLPSAVRDEVCNAGLCCRLLDVISVSKARASRVMYSPLLLSVGDIADIEAIRQTIASSQSSDINNPQNVTHHQKTAIFMNNPPHYPLRSDAPHVVGKMLRFAKQAWSQADWSGTDDEPGPLHAVRGGVSSLSVRVIEHWEYAIGGGLVDAGHYDVDSILTIVVLLSKAEDYTGGSFRTFEPDGSHLEHSMDQGDAICFVSHKYHNITPLTWGCRKSLVMELWQGGVGHSGR